MLRGNKVVLREKQLKDAAADYAWKQDAELAYLDGTLPLTISFWEYLLNYGEQFGYPSLGRQGFAIETLDGKHIGNCMYYNLNKYKQEAEIGISIGDRAYWDKGYGTDAVTVLVNYLFEEMKLRRIYLHTLEENIRAQKCFGKCGFTPCGFQLRDGHNFVIMEIILPKQMEKFPLTKQLGT
jgi:RimJ/RimL family protein N-acetyltransferase